MFSPLVHQNGPLQTTVPALFDLRLVVLIASVMCFPVAVWVLRGDWCVAGWLAAALKIKEIFIYSRSLFNTAVTTTCYIKTRTLFQSLFT